MAEPDLDDPDSQRFLGLLSMLERSALMGMGAAPWPDGEVRFDLTEAKAAIDLLMTLRNKVRGNLSDGEERIFAALVAQLQMFYVQAPERQKQAADEAASQAFTAEAFNDPRGEATAESILDDESE